MNLTVIRIAMRIGISCALIAVGAVDLFIVIRHMAWVGWRCYPQFSPWTLAEDPLSPSKSRICENPSNFVTSIGCVGTSPT